MSREDEEVTRGRDPDEKPHFTNRVVGTPGHGAKQKAGISDTDARIQRRRRDAEAGSGHREPRVDMN